MNIIKMMIHSEKFIGHKLTVFVMRLVKEVLPNWKQHGVLIEIKEIVNQAGFSDTRNSSVI